MVRLVFIGVTVARPDGRGPGVGVRVVRRVPLSPAALRIGLAPIRYPPPRRMLRAQVAGELPMRSGWLKPTVEVLEGARWSEWLSLGAIETRPWPATR
jgi:hypothetical protein